jgi:hypothetical protein
MSGPLKAAFIFVAPDADPAKHRAWVETPQVHLLAVAAKNYEDSAKLAKELAAEGIQAIELCGGFGNLGLAKIVAAVQGKIPVGAVRFDLHPGLGGQSGDALFG